MCPVILWKVELVSVELGSSAEQTCHQSAEGNGSNFVSFLFFFFNLKNVSGTLYLPYYFVSVSGVRQSYVLQSPPSP